MKKFNYTVSTIESITPYSSIFRVFCNGVVIGDVYELNTAKERDIIDEAVYTAMAKEYAEKYS